MSRCLIIFAKEPQKGKVKTRLLSYLTQGGCLKLYKAFLKDTLNLAESIQSEYKILAYDTDADGPRYLKKIGANFRFYRQQGRDLGRRIYNAFKFAKRLKATKTVIIGTDSPNLPPAYIEGAFEGLNNNALVLGPSLDGGFYLVGLKEPCSKIFKNIEWSSDRVLTDTIKKARQLEKKIKLLNKWYDIDGLESFMRLKRDLQRERNQRIAKWTRECLKLNKVF